MNAWFAMLGPLAWPLAACSVLTLVLILERLVFFSLLARLMASRLRFIGYEVRERRWTALAERLANWRGLPAAGLQLLISKRNQSRALREESVSLWLNEQQRRLFVQIKWLMILAAVSLLLGLLGTVLGTIEVFRDTVAHTVPLDSAVLVEGLQQAVLTTVAGLMVAVPALLAGYVFRIWTESYLATLASLLNHINLALDNTFFSSTKTRTLSALIQQEST